MNESKEKFSKDANLKIKGQETLKNCDLSISQGLLNLIEDSQKNEKTIIDQKIYRKLRDASDELFKNVINECSKRLKAIKKSTCEALVVLSLMKKSIDSLYRKGLLVFEDINKLKDYSKQASTHYFTVCQIFNAKIDKIIMKYKPLPEMKSNISQFLNIVEGNACKFVSSWEIEGKKQNHLLPIWVSEQINKGIT